MLIECNHCHATYKIKPKPLPKQKSYVKCSKCGNPIQIPFLDGKESTIQKVNTSCDVCGAQYAIPLEKFKSNKLKVKCGKCQNQFFATKNNVSSPLPLQPSPQPLKGENKKTLNNFRIPKENEIQMEGLFDDLHQESAEEQIPKISEMVSQDSSISENSVTKPTTTETKIQERKLTPQEEYLESISFKVDGDDLELGLGTIPKEQKYKFFLKGGQPPQKKQKELVSDPTSSTQAKEQIHKENHIDTSPNASTLENPVFLENSSLYSIESVHENESQKNRRLLAIFVFCILLGGTLLVAWLTWNDYQISRDSLLRRFFSQDHSQLSIVSQKREQIKNIHYPEKLIVLSGMIQNHYETTDQVSWVEIEGILLDQEGVLVAKAKAYAGNILTPNQLKKWKQAKVEATLAVNTGRTQDNNDLEKEEKIPFQIVFFHVSSDFMKVATRIAGFYRRGKYIQK